jgi:hypothetical protein
VGLVVLQYPSKFDFRHKQLFDIVAQLFGIVVPLKNLARHFRDRLLTVTLKAMSDPITPEY